MTDKTMWCGNCDATEKDQAEVYARYSSSRIDDYRFQVADDLSCVEIDMEDNRASCGTWTLAEARVAYGLTWRQVQSLHNRMLGAIRRYESKHI